MFGLFAICLRSLGSIPLNRGNQEIYLGPTAKKPVVIMLWQHGCFRCKEFTVPWGVFTSNVTESDRFIAADIDCTSELALCLKFRPTHYPYVVWHDPVKRTTAILYDTSDITALRRFVFQRLSFPFLYLQNSSEIEVLAKGAVSSPVFYFRYQHRDNLSIFEPLLLNFLRLDFSFGVIRFPECKLTVRKDIDLEIELPVDKWSNSSIQSFIHTEIFPVFGRFSESYFNLTFTSSKPTAIVFHSDPDRLLAIARHFANRIPFLWTDFTEYEEANTLLKLRGEKRPVLVLLDGKNDRYKKYRGRWTALPLQEWIEAELLNPKGWTKLNRFWGDAYRALSSISPQGKPFYHLYSFVLTLVVLLAGLLFARLSQSATKVRKSGNVSN